MRGLLRDYAGRSKDELDDAVDCGGEALDSAVDRAYEFVERERSRCVRPAARRGVCRRGKKCG